MKMVKSLLLATAAGIAATAGAQAADLPVKAKPVEYVKVCSLYGAGFFYIPGTDTCIRIGGHIRAEYTIGGTNSFAQAYANNGDGLATNTRDRNLYQFRNRAYLYHDTRTQTAYGTLRTYTHIRAEVGSPYGTGAAATVMSLESAIIQWGGFTAGRSQSSYIHSPWLFAYKYNTVGAPGVTDIPTGRNVLAYTHQFGNGLSGTIALEDPKGSTKRGHYNGANALSAPIFAPGTDTRGGNTFPDIVAALRLDQAWGGFWIAGVLTNNHVAYNCGQPGGTCTDINSGIPVSDKIGGAVNASLKINVPTGVNDAIYLHGGYGVGATGHVFSTITQGNGFGSYSERGINGLTGALAFGYIFDSVYDTRAGALNQGSQQLTTAYGGSAAYEHNWNPQWRTSVFGGAQFLDYNASANATLCSKLTVAAGAAGPGTLVLAPGQACNMDFRVVQAGTRTVWEPVKDLTFGVEFIYSQLSGKNNGSVLLQNANNGGRPAGAYLLKDQDVFSGTLSVRRFF
jgi:hypothetical protein